MLRIALFQSIKIMVASRRNFLKYVSAAPIAVGAVSSVFPIYSDAAFANVIPNARLGSITGNDPAGYMNFATWFGRKPQLAHLYFNQTSAANLQSSISYICQQGKAFIADGAQILWSVPCPGPRQLEAIIAMSYDSLYTSLFKSILAVSPADGTPIFVRPPWEFNLAWQDNAAIDKAGNWNPSVFKQAWQRIARIAKYISPRFMRIWCPNVTTMGLDPQTCWPDQPNVDIVAQDFYMQSAYNNPGDFSWFLSEARGLQWGASFAAMEGKPYGLSEWGMDSDTFAADFNSAASWLSSLGKAVHHQCWWDRSDGIDCRISDGTHPGLAAAYQNQFY